MSRVFSVRPATDCCEVIAELDNGGTYRRHQPDIRGPVAYWIKNAFDLQLNETVVPPHARVVRVRNGSVHGPGVVTLPGDIIVSESLINCGGYPTVGGLERLGDGEKYVATKDYSEGPKVPDGIHVLLKQMWDGNYGHWLIEGLPRVALLRNIVDFSSARFIVSLQSAQMQRVFADSLSAFGIDENQILIAGARPIQVEELIYPLPLTVQPWVKAPRVFRTLEALITETIPAVRQGNYNPRIFVNRLDTSRRKLGNRDAVVEHLRRHGFSIVTPAHMTFHEQMAAFVNARYVVGVLGAELANLAFSPMGCRLLGLAPSYMQDDFFFDLVSHKNGHYISLHGDPIDGTHDMNSTFEVDIKMFHEALENILSY